MNYSGSSAFHGHPDLPVSAFQQMIQEFLTDQYTDIRAAGCAFFQPADRPPGCLRIQKSAV